jgi:nucleotide-binding universal stress UspA family protein
MPYTIVVAVDDSEPATRVLPFAARIAQAMDGRVVLVRVIPDEALRMHAELAIERLRWNFPAGLPHSLHVSVGDPATEIVQLVEAENSKLVVMASEHLSTADRWLNGSVADEVLRRAPAPVLVVPANVTRLWRLDGMRTLVPLDGSVFSETILEPAIELAHALSATLVLLRAAETSPAAQEYTEEVATRLAEQGADVSFHIVHGSPADEIVAAANQHDVDLIAMATHGRTGLARLAAGSVATSVLQQAERPVLLVRPQALHQPDVEPIPERYTRALVPPLPWLGA